jgi:hypothetical protein
MVGKLWDIGVRYQVSEDARPMHEFCIGSDMPSLVALSPDAKLLVLAVSTTLSFIDVASGGVRQLPFYQPFLIKPNVPAVHREH